MTPLEALARSAADYLLVAFALAVVTATLLLAAEELGVRQAVHRFAVREWLTQGTRRAFNAMSWQDRLAPPADAMPLADLPISPSSYALPYKQLVAVVGSLVQADLRTGAPYPFANTFAEIGQGTMFDRRQTISPSDFSTSTESHEADLNFFAERALDDLQAFLALYTARTRYLLSMVAVSVQVSVLWLQRTDVVGATFGSMALYPTAIVAAVLFAPVLKDAIDRISR